MKCGHLWKTKQAQISKHQNMNIKQVLAGAVLCLAISCQQNHEQALLKEISALESKVLKSGNATKELDAAKELVEKSAAFAKQYPGSKATPEILFRAGDVARGAKEYGKAIELWGKLRRNYADNPKAPMALFLQGFTFDGDLQNAEKAAGYYKEFLKTYPDDSLATQVRQLLNVVEMSPDDLVRQFKENQ